MADKMLQQSMAVSTGALTALADHRSTKSTSFAAIGATLVPVIVTAAIYMIAFNSLRDKYRNIYAPRTYFRTIPDKDRTPSSSRSSVSWLHDFRALDDKFVLRHSSIDGYLFLRFLKIICVICAVGCCLTWPILFPINATGGGGATQLDRITFSNIDSPKRLYAHAVVAWLYFGFILLLITRERLFAIGLRQAHSTVKGNALRLSSKIVLFLNVPKEGTDKDNLTRFFGSSAVRSWTASSLTKLEGLVSDRNDKTTELENAEVKLQKRANAKAQKLGRDGASNGAPSSLTDDVERPYHNDYYIFGDKHDTISTRQKEIQEIATKIQDKRDSRSDQPTGRNLAIFVEFKDQVSAQQAYQQVQHHSPFALQPRYIGVRPKEVLWENLNIDPSLRITYYYTAIAFIVATTILWSIPIGIIGTISNVSYLADKVKFLSWINDLPSPILGFLTGFVPPYILSEVVSYVPNFFRIIAKRSGQPTTVEAEKLTQHWYFIFQVIQVFLITTFSSGAATVVTKIANEPGSIPTLLANNLPKASNFYLSYFIIQGIATTSNQLLNYSDVFSYVFYTKYLDETPRQLYTTYSNMKGIGWGKSYPKFTNLAVIAIAYSCIAPLMLGFATLGLYLFFLCYKYNFLYVTQIKTETRGANYTIALQHLMTGIYLAEICLIGLCGVKEASGPSAMLVVLFVLTIIYHITVNKYLRPLEEFIPLDILQSNDEEEPLLSDHDEEPRDRSRVIQLGAGKLPKGLLDPLAVFLEPHIFASQEQLRPWLTDPASSNEDIPEYTEDELKNAYVNPALTSKTPKLWLPKDKHGISKKEIEENEKFGILGTDDGAELDAKGKISWNPEDFTTVPVFKSTKKY